MRDSAIFNWSAKNKNSPCGEILFLSVVSTGSWLRLSFKPRSEIAISGLWPVFVSVSSP